MAAPRARPALIVAVLAAVLVAAAGVVVTRLGGDDHVPRPRASAGPGLPAGEHPTAATTGVPDGVALRPSGALRITDAGEVVEGLEVTGHVVVAAEGVTIRNTRINVESDIGVRVESGASLLIEDSDIVGVDGRCADGVGFGGYEAVRIDVSGCEDGLKANGDVVVRDSYIHDLRADSGSHNDGIQTMGGTDITIERNTVCGPYRGSVSAIKMTPEEAAIDGVEIRDNLLYGGNFTLYMDSRPDGFGLVTNAVVAGNTITAGSYADGWRAVDEDPTQSFSDNVEVDVDLCGGGAG